MGRPTESHLRSLASTSQSRASPSPRSSSPPRAPSSSPSPKKPRQSAGSFPRGLPPMIGTVEERFLTADEWAVHPLNRDRSPASRRRPAGRDSLPSSASRADREVSPTMRELIDRFGVLSDEIIGLEEQEGISAGLRRSLATLERVLREGLIRFGDEGGGSTVQREEWETTRGVAVGARGRLGGQRTEATQGEPLVEVPHEADLADDPTPPLVNIPSRSRPSTT